MGLDQYLYKRKNGEPETIENTNHEGTIVEVANLGNTVVTWRKAYQIDSWFGETLVGGPMPNCEAMEVTIDQLQDLVANCIEALTAYHTNDDYNILRKKLKELSFSIDSMFYPNGIDAWYIAELRHTLKYVSNVLAEHKEGDVYHYYIWY